MKDMFDCLEEEEIRPYEFVFLIKRIRRNKKARKNNANTFLYLSKINSDGSLKFMRGLINAMDIKHSYYYDHIKNTVRSGKITCEACIMSNFQYCELIYGEFKPIKKETWWDRIKVWFSRKIIGWVGWLAIERPMKD